MFLFFSFLTGLTLTNYVHCSAGDHSPYYQKCVERCEIFNCTEDGQQFKENKQSIIYSITQWSCEDECKYECMWQTVDGFHERKWRTPQFYGKWPFIRFLGIQEPASVAFSLLNAYVHFRMINKFHKEVRPDSPLKWMWYIYSMVHLNAWFWSTIFHTRDFPWTELLDYASAYSVLLSNCYVMAIRLLWDVKVPSFTVAIVTVLFIAFLGNHTAYLSLGGIDYGYNMELNILTGAITALFWFSWCFYNRFNQPYVWKCAIHIALHGVSLLLEITDCPPFLYVFDCHSLWHLSTAPIAILIYSFAIDDCKYLRNLQYSQLSEGKKKP